MTVDTSITRIRDEALDRFAPFSDGLGQIRSTIAEPMEIIDQAYTYGKFLVYGTGIISVISMAALTLASGPFGFLILAVVSVANGLICHESYVLLDGVTFIKDKVATCLHAETLRRSEIRSGFHAIADKVETMKNSFWLIGSILGEVADRALDEIRNELIPALNNTGDNSMIAGLEAMLRHGLNAMSPEQRETVTNNICTTLRESTSTAPAVLQEVIQPLLGGGGLSLHRHNAG